jgi:hypothetical protein
LYLLCQVFLPYLSLALEYQGEIHYFSSHLFGKASDRQRADHNKQQLAKQYGITLIPVPFWWDKSPSTLAATIRLYRPDINFNVAVTQPISSDIPSKLQNNIKWVPSAAKVLSIHHDPKGL